MKKINTSALFSCIFLSLLLIIQSCFTEPPQTVKSKSNDTNTFKIKSGSTISPLFISQDFSFGYPRSTSTQNSKYYYFVLTNGSTSSCLGSGTSSNTQTTSFGVRASYSSGSNSWTTSLGNTNESSLPQSGGTFISGSTNTNGETEYDKEKATSLGISIDESANVNLAVGAFSGSTSTSRTTGPWSDPTGPKNDGCTIPSSNYSGYYYTAFVTTTTNSSSGASYSFPMYSADFRLNVSDSFEDEGDVIAELTYSSSISTSSGWELRITGLNYDNVYTGTIAGSSISTGSKSINLGNLGAGKYKVTAKLTSYPSANIVREVNIIRKARSCNRTCQNNYANDPDVEIICGCENEIEFCSVGTNQSGNEVESCFSCPSGQNIIFQDNIPIGCEPLILTDNLKAPLGLKSIQVEEFLNETCE